MSRRTKKWLHTFWRITGVDTSKGAGKQELIIEQTRATPPKNASHKTAKRMMTISSVLTLLLCLHCAASTAPSEKRFDVWYWSNERSYANGQYVLAFDELACVSATGECRVVYECYGPGQTACQLTGAKP